MTEKYNIKDVIINNYTNNKKGPTEGPEECRLVHVLCMLSL